MRKARLLLVAVVMAVFGLVSFAPAASAGCTQDICWDQVCYWLDDRSAILDLNCTY